MQIGFDEASVIELPSIAALHHLGEDDLPALKYLLWGTSVRRYPCTSPAALPRRSRRPT